VPFTFDSTVKRAARARAGERAERPLFISGMLPAPPTDDVVLADLIAFFRDPVKGFFRALDYTLPWEVDGVDDAMPVDINALEEWTVGDRMLQDMLHGMDADQARQAEWRCGTLPPETRGAKPRDSRSGNADRRHCPALPRRRTQGRRRRHDLGNGRRLTGTVSPVYATDSSRHSLQTDGRLYPAVDSVAGIDRSHSRTRLARHPDRPPEGGTTPRGDHKPGRGVSGRAGTSCRPPEGGCARRHFLMVDGGGGAHHGH
jgi:exodeoxyribonuclease V gamma subunit